MSDDLIKRLRHKNCCETVCQCDEAADRIEELVKEQEDAAKWAEVLRETYQRAKVAEAKLAKAVEALREIDQNIMFYTDETSWRVWGEEAVINIRKVLAELEKTNG
jgi:hypothetical protein